MEREFHNWLKSLQGSRTGSQIRAQSYAKIGIGDDAAVLNPLSGELVVTTDTIADGTHFETSQHTLERIGRKAMAVNLSDLAAMGARPLVAVLTMMLPRTFSLRDAQEIYSGCQKLTNEFQLEIVGGDTNSWDGPLVVGATLLGTHYEGRVDDQFWTMDRAQPGDRVIVSGEFGGSILGRHLDFMPRVELAKYLMENYSIHAATDASDSLSLDLSAVAVASGAGVEVQEELIPISDAARELSQRDGITALTHALSDGEDFELILAVPPTEAKRLLADSNCPAALVDMGEFVAQSGFRILDPAGQTRTLEPTGYSH